MSSKAYREAVAKREAASEMTLQQAYEVAIKKGLTSESAVERSAALQQAGAILTPNLGSLRDEIKSLTKQSADAEAALTNVIRQRDGAQFFAALLKPLAERLPVIEQELAAMKASMETWQAEQVRLLTEKSAQQLSQAARSERNAAHKLALVESNYAPGTGLAETFDTIRALVEKFNIPQPDFWSSSPNLTPIFWTLWPGWTSAKAQTYVGFKKSYPTCTANFKQEALWLMKASLPSFGVEVRSDFKIENYSEKLEAARELAQRFKILDELIREVEKEHIYRAGIQRQQSLLSLHGQEDDQIRQEIMTRAKEQNDYDDKNSTLRPDQRNSLAPLGESEEW